MSILHNLPIKLIEICNVEVHLCCNRYTSDWYIDFNTGMKSHLHLYYEDGKYIAKCRYGREDVIEDFHDFHTCLVKCMEGRDFMNSSWIDIYHEGFGEFTWDKINGGNE